MSYVYGALELANYINLEPIKDLNCVKNFKCPYSLHSVDLLPSSVDNRPGLASVTFRHGGEIRTVHGCQEIYTAIQKAFKDDEEKIAEETKEKEDKDNKGKEEEKNEVWKKTVNSELFGTSEGIRKLSQMVENLAKAGWEVVTAGNFTTTPKYEIITLVLKKSPTPQPETAVTAVVIDAEKRKLEVIGNNPHIQVNNVLQQIVESLQSPSTDSENVEKEKSSSTKIDDTNCPSSFEIATKDMDSGRIVLDVTRKLFCRQWKLILPHEENNRIILFFAKDPRILPSLGESTFSLCSLQKDSLRLYSLANEVENEIKRVLNEFGGGFDESVKSEEIKGSCKELLINESVWNGGQKQEPYDFAKHMLISRLLLALNNVKMNIFSCLIVGRGTPEQKIMMILRQSNVLYSKSMILQPKGLNKLTIYGASEEELKAIRNCLKSRWPYPLTRDDPLDEDWHLMKVKRYPWNVSYGNKHADKAMELAKEGLKNTEVNVPHPSNMDSESAKSLVLFLIKELGDFGWRVQMTADVFSDNKVLFGRNDILPTRPKDADALFLLK